MHAALALEHLAIGKLSQVAAAQALPAIDENPRADAIDLQRELAISAT